MIRLVIVALFGTCVLSAADTPYWVEPCTDPATSCVAADPDLARWAIQAWQEASGGRLHFAPVTDRAQSLIRLIWAKPSEGLYGETMAISVGGHQGAQINVRIADGGTKDHLLRDTIVYLTCLHELGHALGLSHTSDFRDIMYFFGYGGDIVQYFGRYREQLRARNDIARVSGLSAGDLNRLHTLYPAP